MTFSADRQSLSVKNTEILPSMVYYRAMKPTVEGAFSCSIDSIAPNLRTLREEKSTHIQKLERVVRRARVLSPSVDYYMNTLRPEINTLCADFITFPVIPYYSHFYNERITASPLRSTERDDRFQENEGVAPDLFGVYQLRMYGVVLRSLEYTEQYMATRADSSTQQLWHLFGDLTGELTARHHPELAKDMGIKNELKQSPQVFLLLSGFGTALKVGNVYRLPSEQCDKRLVRDGPGEAFMMLGQTADSVSGLIPELTRLPRRGGTELLDSVTLGSHPLRVDPTCFQINWPERKIVLSPEYWKRKALFLGNSPYTTTLCPARYATLPTSDGKPNTGAIDMLFQHERYGAQRYLYAPLCGIADEEYPTPG